jgi:hypothetical protein
VVLIFDAAFDDLVMFGIPVRRAAGLGSHLIRCRRQYWRHDVWREHAQPSAET